MMQRHDFDVVVIGAGGCGMVAALAAAQGGSSAALLEKTGAPGGGTALSSKGIRAAGSRFQESQGISDSPEQYAQDILRRNGSRSDPILTKQLAANTKEVAHWLADVVGMDLHVAEFRFGHSASRSHTWAEDKAITDYLYEAVRRQPRIQVFLSTPATALAVDRDGAVMGAVTGRGTFHGRKTILATGGFGASQELLARYIPKAVGIPFPGHAGSTGDGLKMALGLGAVPAHMDAFQPYPAYLGPGTRAVSPEVMMAGGITVDKAGNRFTDETRYPGGISSAIIDLPDKHAYEVFDQRILDYAAPRMPDLIAEGAFAKAGTPVELAGLLGVDPRGLERTVLEYNALAGKQDAFGRLVPEPLRPPFYGIRVTVALYHTQGGIRVNTEAQVLREDGSVVPNLYAGGGVAEGVSGDGMQGYLPGNGQLASLGLGFIAGKHAARSLTAPV